MPACRNCGARLTKFDKDVCPVCGTKNPLEGVTSDTVEMTSFINMEQNKDFRVKKKSTMLFYSFVAGFTGLPFFYLHAIKKGIIYENPLIFVLKNSYFFTSNNLYQLTFTYLK